jgi:hypothetical protein
MAVNNEKNKNKLKESLVNKPKEKQIDSANTINGEDIDSLRLSINKMENVIKTKLVKQSYTHYESFHEIDIGEKIDKIHNAVKQLKTHYRERIKQNVRDYISKRNFLRTKQEEFNKKTGAIVDKVSNVINSFKKFAFSSIKKVWGLLKKTSKYVINVGIKILDFLLVPFKLGWKFIDGFLSSLSPQGWGVIKKVSSVIFDAATWVWKIGKKMVEYIWEGVKTIFKFGYDVMSTVGTTIYKGAKFLFSFWFKMLTNTLFNPAMWLINVPIFLALTGVMFLALGTVTSLLMDLTIPLIKPLLKLSQNVLGWLWSGIKFLWKWVKKQYDGSWLQKFINTYIVDGIFSWFMNIEIVQKVVNFVKLAYNWLKTNAGTIINFLSDTVDTIVKFINNMSGESFLVSFLNFFNDSIILRNIPGISKMLKFLNSKYGFLPGLRISGESPALNVASVRRSIKSISQQKVKTMIEYQSVKMISEGKTEKEIIDYLNETVIPTLSDDISRAKLTDEQVKGIINDHLAVAKEIVKSGGKGAIKDYEDAMFNQTRVILKYEEIYRQMRSGILDATSSETLKRLEKDRLDALNVTKKFFERSESESLPETKYNLSDMQRGLKKFQEQWKLTSKLQNYETFTDAIDQQHMVDQRLMGMSIVDIPDIQADPYSTSTMKSLQTAQAVGMTTINVTAPVVGKAVMLAGNVAKYAVKSVADDIRRNQVETATMIHSKSLREMSLAKSQYKKEDIVDKFELGGIIDQNVNNKMPLDDLSAKYIREKVEDLEKHKKLQNKNNEKSEVKNNITIIDNTIIHEESYELYTLSQLSRSLLAGG